MSDNAYTYHITQFPSITMSHQEQNMSPSQPMQSSGSPHNLPIDPSLNMQYPPISISPSPPPPHHLPPHLSMQQNYSSPSSGASDTVGTPPVDHMYPPSSSNLNGKRPASSSRKKIRRDDDSESAQSPLADKDEKPKPTRGSRACTVCRRLKMKCVGAEHGPPCKRCITGNHECIFEESNRGKRSSKKHEQLSRSLRKMERTLDTVLKSIGNPSIASGMISRTASYSSHHHHGHVPGSPKLHSLPDNALNPLGLLAEASLANRRSQASKPQRNTSTGDPKLGVASDNYFKPGPMTILPLRRLYIERQIQPEMLSFVSTDEVVALFDIYFEHINRHCATLDRSFHTPSLVCSRSPFLLTTICSIASKFYTAKPELHPRLTELAKKLAFSVPAKGYKSVEIVQAYILLALWGCGAVERYEQDKTWLLLGMAIRMATDLNLHRKTATSSADTAEGKARDVEVHNRERTWILCFALDRSFSAQMGKANYIIRNADQWCHSPVAVPSDVSLVAYAELQRVLSRSLDFLYSGTDSANGLQTNIDYLLVIKTFEAQLYTWKQRWCVEALGIDNNIRMEEYKRMITEFYLNYALLVLNSFGLQNALERCPMNIPHFFARCHTSAIACATLLIRPEFQAYLDNEQHTLQLVKDVADVLDEIAANPLHTPALYSGFLRALISAKLEAPSNCRMAIVNQQQHTEGGFNLLNEFQFEGEMGPVGRHVDSSRRRWRRHPADGNSSGLAMENILSSGFWDSMLVPGYNSMDGFSGGFVFGAGGSGLITPRFGISPMHSGTNTPGRHAFHHHHQQSQLTQHSINAAFKNKQVDDEGNGEGIKIDAHAS
ncbi:fungal-specific transcription factor domain-containing protein [Ephemerocybe angulata]|uniref:Fungal-specific transcription factor domain-containing protein n=1 Tax=Ephemerocybe angulata TaxID=980116 RepID=A0A8H6IF08_9AGAR|nr:fungal-specific transcription factor domain-containing protein [Tulosesus angulatus]